MRLARVAIIFDNFGPYHWARLEAAGRVCDLLAIEVRDNCAEHGWVRLPRQAPFQTLTLLKGASGKKISLRNLSDRLRKALAEFKPQAVFLPGWFCSAAFVAHNWCSINSVPVIIMSESNSWDEKRSVLKEWVKRRLVRNYSAALVGGSGHKKYMVELGMPADRIFPGYDAVDNDYFAAKAARFRPPTSELRTQLKLPEKYFLASARFVEKKNLSRLLEAYSLYRQNCASPLRLDRGLEFFGKGRKEFAEGEGPQRTERAGASESLGQGDVSSVSTLNSQLSTINYQRSTPPWNLVLLGDGPLRPTLNSQLSTLNLNGHVQLPGFIQYEDLPRYYGLASGFVHASSTEQWGLVVNEALSAGLPVLVSNRCGCAADLVREGVNGFTFDPLNVEQIASLMLKLSTLNSELPTLGAAGREIVSQWGTERFAKGVSAAVDKALEIPMRRMSFFDRFILKLLAVSR